MEKKATEIFKTEKQRQKTKKTGVYYKRVFKVVQEKHGLTREKEFDRVYFIQFRDREGKWRIRSVGKHSEGVREKDCVQKRSELLLQNKDVSSEAGIAVQSKFLFGEIAEKYLNSIELTHKDFKNIKGRYQNHIKPLFEHRDIYSITEDDLLLVQRLMLNSHSPKTINHVVGTIGTIFSYATKKLKIRVNNPKTETKNLKVSNSRERFLDKDEIDLLLKSVSYDRILEFFTALALSTGGRVATILNIRKVDVNLKNKTINLYDFKNESQYTGFISKKLYPIIEDRIKNLDKTDLLIHEDDGKLMQGQLQKHLDILFNEGLKKDDRRNRAVPHTLRHSFASNLAINGVPIYTIQKLMNHRDINMTLRYAKLSPENGQKEVWTLY